jgi:hypothetical protein
MERVTLFHFEDEEILIDIQLYFNEKDQLYFDGCDIGKRVKEIWGDSDYEYTYTIEPDEVNKMYSLLHVSTGNRLDLLLAIQKNFSGNDAYSKFGEFLNGNNIKYEGFTWA